MTNTPDRDPFAADMPSQDVQRARREAMRYDSSAWGMLPLVLGILFVAILGLMLLNTDRTPGPERTGISTNAPGTSTKPPTITPTTPGDTPTTQPTTPKAQ